MGRLVRHSPLRRQDAAITTWSPLPARDFIGVSKLPNSIKRDRRRRSFREQRSDVRLGLEGDPERFIFKACTERARNTDKGAHRWRLLGEISAVALVQKS